MTREFRSISYANVCPRNFDDDYANCHRRIAYLDRIHVSNMRGEVRVRVNHAVSDKVTVDVVTYVFDALLRCIYMPAIDRSHE